MDTNGYYFLLAPVFAAAMFLEALVARLRGRRVYAGADTLSNLCCGIGQNLLGLFTVGFLLASYDWFRGAFAMVTWPDGSVAPWVLAFVGVDLCYYVWHRSSHRVPILWAIHAPHHQSAEMNLSVALRQPFISDLSAMLFYWPLPLLGVPRDLLAVGAHSLYVTLMHTRVVDGLGPWSRLFNAPAFHRLHHAVDDGYRDHNFAATFILWDRLFGTFVRETTAPRYGLIEPLGSYDPLWAQVQPFVALVRRARRAGSLRAALAACFVPSAAVREADRRQRVPRPAAQPVPRPALRFATAQLAVLATVAFVIIRGARSLSPAQAAVGVGCVFVGMAALGALLDARMHISRSRSAP